MEMTALQVLFIEDDPDDVHLIEEQLGESGLAVDLTHAGRLTVGLTLLDAARPDAILLDLSLPDCCGPATLEHVRTAAPTVPIVVLTGLEDDALGLALVQAGAQDYLVKGQVTGPLLVRSIRYAIERKRTEEALAQAKQIAESASRAKSEFLANVSHELRTPMNAILGLTDLALASDPPQDLREGLELVRSSAESLLALIDNVLDLTAVEAGRIVPEPTTFRLRAALEQVVARYADRAREKGLGLHLRCGAEVPDEVVGDPHRLCQALVHLIDNGIKFTDRGEVALAVELGSSSKTHVEVRFTVRDTGIGMRMEQAESVLEPFMQADGSLSRRYGGLGLGLALATRLIELMGGRIAIETSLGIGTTIHFTIRLGIPAAALQAWSGVDSTFSL